MILLLDIGNSRIKWCWHADGRWFGDGAVGRNRGAAGTAFPFFDSAPARPEAVLAANVAGDQTAAALTLAVRQNWDLPVEFARTRSRWGALRNGYEDPRQLGVDRWLTLVAACGQPDEAVCVVDAGTALTVDLLEPGGRHLGGYIVPGLDLMEASLEVRTGEIRLRAGATGASARAGSQPGRDTRSAMRQGAALAAAGLIERAQALMSCSPLTLVTGGDAEVLLGLLPARSQHRPRLVLEGLLQSLGPGSSPDDGSDA